MASPRLLSRSPLTSFLRLPIQTTSRATLIPSTLSRVHRPFASSQTKATPTKMSNTDTLIELAKARRTIYKLGKNSPVPDSKIEEVVNAAIQHIPSSFNTQSTRLVVLLHAEHERLWEIVIDTFMQLVQSGAVPEATWKNQTLPKLQGMKNGVGTVCLPATNPLEATIKLTHRYRSSSTKTQHTSSPSPRNSQPTRSTSSPGQSTRMPCTSTSVRSSPPISCTCTHAHTNMHETVWTALESLGFGANLQHYNPLIDTPVAKQWDIPSEWRLIAQLVFGSPEGEPGEKTQKPIEERVKIFGKL